MVEFVLKDEFYWKDEIALCTSTFRSTQLRLNVEPYSCQKQSGRYIDFLGFLYRRLKMKDISAQPYKDPPSPSLDTSVRVFYTYRSAHAVRDGNLPGKEKVFRDSTHVQ